jgi:superfamily II DNA helicase RecQ
MQDQVRQLRLHGIAAACLHQGLDLQRRRQLQQGLNDQSLRVIRRSGSVPKQGSEEQKNMISKR